LGIVCVLVLVLVWVGLGEGSQALQTGSHNAKYNKPFFQTYVIHSAYTVCLGVWSIWYILCVFKKKPNENPITLKIFLTAGLMAILSFASGLFWYISLPETTVGVNTAVYQASCIFIYIFSIFILKEKITFGKILSVSICVSGVVLLSLYGTDTTGNSVEGIIWVLASTIVYSLAETIYGKIIHNRGVSWNFSFLFLGLMGAFTALFLWPVILIVHVTQYEVWEFPSLFVLGYYVLYSFLDTIFNVGFFIGIHLTSPLFMAVGTLLTIPVSIIVDKFWHNIDLSWISGIGMILVVLGFLGLNLSESLAEWVRNKRGSSNLFIQFLMVFIYDFRLLCDPEKPKTKPTPVV